MDQIKNSSFEESIFSMSNYHDTIALFRMALADIKRVIRSYQEEDFADSAFRIQFCCEKILKGLILLYGGQFKKIHNPSIVIKDEILIQYELKDQEKENLLKIIDDASILEDLATTTRYGLEDQGIFIEPESIYTQDSIKNILPPLMNIITTLIEVLKSNENIVVWQQIIEDFEDALKKLQFIMD